MKEGFLKGRIPFALDDSGYHRFSERNSVFSRVGWDESLPAFGRRIWEREKEMVGRKGYSRVGYAANAASWIVHDHWVSRLSHEASEPQPEFLTQVSSALPRYESDDPRLNTDRIKRLGQVFGACDIGVASIDEQRRFVYSHDRSGKQINLPEEIEYVIVILIQMDYLALMTSPRLPASITKGNAYSRAAFAADCLAETISNLGYQAIPSVNSIGLSVPLAVLAGLGEFGRNGLLIHPKFGQSVRIAKVFTDIPLIPDSPTSFGVADFCRVCRKCAKSCPSRSIPDGEPTWESPSSSRSNNDGVYKWYVNAETCYEFWTRNSTDCSNCIRACPFTKPPGIAHEIVRFFIRNFRFLNRLWVKLDDIMGYGKIAEPDKFWKSKAYLDKKIVH
ncbi:MAG: reductive dehalogenase [Candidatus Bathyarchaeota archaeon]|nr:MAG: reductive dehalogenase [Candidatus Bathyarchaeota archaeon]